MPSPKPPRAFKTSRSSRPTPASRAAATRRTTTPTRTRRSDCPIAFSLDLLGDRWTLLVLRDLLLVGKQRFAEFQAAPEGMASNVLADRLQALHAAGLVERRPDPQDGRRVIYRPGPAALDLLPVLLELIRWGATHDARTAAPKAFVERIARDRAGVEAELRRRHDG